MRKTFPNLDGGLCAGVVIGRNEGDRLVRCLELLLKSLSTIVYVDSGSTDGSLDNAKELGVVVIQLDLTIPFTAARARNEGAAYLIGNNPDIEYIQFVDGDCEVQPDWLEKAENFLTGNDKYAIVCGRRRERFPEQSIYNQLCDIEWNTPIGDALACGGDALIRVKSFKQVSGYNESLIAGEEPEMCFRLRDQGWNIRRIDAEMTLHDAAMTKVGQWWNRAKRAGYAYASSCYLHGHSEEHFKVKEVISIITWACILPILIVFLSISNVSFIAILILYPLQIIRLVIKAKTLNKGRKVALFHALSILMAKFPQFLGIVRFWLDKFKGAQAHLIEYK